VRTTHTSNGPASTADAETFDHGVVSRFNAWFFTAFAGPINHFSRDHKRHAFAGIDAATVVELGAGTGANFGHLRPGTVVHAVEPNLRMHDRLRTRAAAVGVDLRLQAGGAARIALPDASVDEVICSLVLCSVADVDAVLAEVRRVLRPGGRFRFVEHVAACGLRGRVQRVVRRPWGWLFEGCDPHPATTQAIERAGFAHVTIQPRKLRRSPFWPVNTAVWGIAER
jgi:ubiquinone/menaquinone biosynthesis C-methylase UbiE